LTVLLDRFGREEPVGVVRAGVIEQILDRSVPLRDMNPGLVVASNICTSWLPRKHAPVLGPLTALPPRRTDTAATAA
jgi:hypothetical protein